MFCGFEFGATFTPVMTLQKDATMENPLISELLKLALVVIKSQSRKERQLAKMRAGKIRKQLHPSEFATVLRRTLQPI